MNKLEEAVLRLFFESEKVWHVNFNLNQVRILKRDSIGSGFMKWFFPNELDVIDGPLNFTGGRVVAKINGKIDVGFLVHIKDCYVYVLEGYTYDEQWPEKVNSFELDLINFSGSVKK